MNIIITVYVRFPDSFKMINQKRKFLCNKRCETGRQYIVTFIKLNNLFDNIEKNKYFLRYT